MSTEPVLQHPGQPTNVLAALENLAEESTEGLRLAVAYTTVGGCRYLVPRLANRIGGTWGTLPKTLITCFDFGMTDPDALRYLRDDHGFELRAINTPGSSYHPKLYLLSDGGAGGAFVGSANLTRAAMTTNTEMGIALRFSARHGELEDHWATLRAASTPLAEPEITAYEGRRRASPPPLPPDPAPVTRPTPSAPAVPPLIEAIAGGFDPNSFNAMWIEAGSMSSSGSHSQLELPRGANRFFGFSFSTYDDAHHTIGTPVLFTAGRAWSNRPLTWHGNNRMERINLPTPAQGGFAYRDTAILFRRRGPRFQLQVAGWTSTVAATWRSASAASTFRLGRNSPRVCGFF